MDTWTHRGIERQIAVGMDLDRTDGATAQQQQQQQWRGQHLLWICCRQSQTIRQLNKIRRYNLDRPII